MVTLKTRETTASVEKFLNSIVDETRRNDAFTVLALMKQVTGEEAKMWGSAIIGFGSRKLVYESGRELDWMNVGFSPRKANITLYIMDGFAKYDTLLARLGKHKTGKSCLYIDKLGNVDVNVLKKLVKQSVQHVKSNS